MRHFRSAVAGCQQFRQPDVSVIIPAPYAQNVFDGCLAASGEVPPREGVLELMDEAREKGLLVGVCSAATKGSAVAVVQSLLGPQRFEVQLSPAEKMCGRQCMAAADLAVFMALESLCRCICCMGG